MAVALARLVHDELEVYGTSGNQALEDPEMREALIALSAINKRLGYRSIYHFVTSALSGATGCAMTRMAHGKPGETSAATSSTRRTTN